jgi:hypothetical protein
MNSADYNQNKRKIVKNIPIMDLPIMDLIY